MIAVEERVGVCCRCFESLDLPQLKTQGGLPKAFFYSEGETRGWFGVRILFSWCDSAWFLSLLLLQ